MGLFGAITALAGCSNYAARDEELRQRTEDLNGRLRSIEGASILTAQWTRQEMGEYVDVDMSIPESDRDLALRVTEEVYQQIGVLARGSKNDAIVNVRIMNPDGTEVFLYGKSEGFPRHLDDVRKRYP